MGKREKGRIIYIPYDDKNDDLGYENLRTNVNEVPPIDRDDADEVEERPAGKRFVKKDVAAESHYKDSRLQAQFQKIYPDLGVSVSPEGEVIFHLNLPEKLCHPSAENSAEAMEEAQEFYHKVLLDMCADGVLLGEMPEYDAVAALVHCTGEGEHRTIRCEGYKVPVKQIDYEALRALTSPAQRFEGRTAPGGGLPPL